jgi:predicted nucleic acid-binding protein
MGVVVFDSDVLIGFLNANDPHQQDAVDWMKTAMTPGMRRMLCAVNYSEILIGPMRAGNHQIVDQMLTRLNIETVVVDMDLARRAAAVRERTNLKLPDAYALATCMHAERSGHDDVRLATFDQSVLNAHTALHPSP